MGVAIGPGFGVALGLALGNLALGIGVGLALGVAIGLALEKSNNPNPIEPSEEEKRRISKWMRIGLLSGVAGLLLLLILYMLSR